MQRIRLSARANIERATHLNRFWRPACLFGVAAFSLGILPLDFTDRIQWIAEPYEQFWIGGVHPRKSIESDPIDFPLISLVHHSDRGSQYVSIRYTERLAEAGIEPSAGSKGDSYDNALAETINGLYKAEMIHRRGPWKSPGSVELATLEWVSWFNHQRLMEPLGYIPPAEAEANYYRQLASQAALAA